MREARGDLFAEFAIEGPIAVTTNGASNKAGNAVMGAGCALSACEKHPDLSQRLGSLLRISGNHVYWFADLKVFSFPVKHHWSEYADLELIERSCRELMTKLDEMAEDDEGEPWVQPLNQSLYLPRPGCGLGRLQWADVKAVIAPILDDRVVVVTF